ncbi:MAG TPA: hypothetical protein VMW47_08725 [Verrucomicrobiae bacterium]|nr:hypothetical protein [Verrucomicrobiae bacterium]
MSSGTDASISDAELTARVRGWLADAAGASSVHASRPDPRTVVIDAHATSNYLPVLTPGTRRRLVEAVRMWLPEVVSVRVDPHH